MTASAILRALRANMKLGWDQEGNWAPPLVYLLFALIAPIAGVLMLVFMYLVVKGGSTDKSFLMFILVGATVYLFVRLVLQGAGFAVVEDREHYRILRYIYIAPAPFPVQIAGRVAVKLLIAAVSVIVTFLCGYYFLGVTFRPDGILWGTFFGSFALGLTGLIAIGWMLASMMLLIDRMGWVWAEGIAGLMFLVTGAVVPFSLLPTPFIWLGKILPMTYWVELWRHALYGADALFALPGLKPNQLWMMLAITTPVWVVIAALWYRVADNLARKWGRVERETFY